MEWKGSSEVSQGLWRQGDPSHPVRKAKEGTEVSRSKPSRHREGVILKFTNSTNIQEAETSPDDERNESLREEVTKAEAWGRGRRMWGLQSQGRQGFPKGEMRGTELQREAVAMNNGHMVTV